MIDAETASGYVNQVKSCNKVFIHINKHVKGACEIN